jgi:hypothetical protein
MGLILSDLKQSDEIVCIFSRFNDHCLKKEGVHAKKVSLRSSIGPVVWINTFAHFLCG